MSQQSNLKVVQMYCNVKKANDAKTSKGIKKRAPYDEKKEIFANTYAVARPEAVPTLKSVQRSVMNKAGEKSTFHKRNFACMKRTF